MTAACQSVVFPIPLALEHEGRAPFGNAAEEDSVIAKLEKMIDDLEQQRQMRQMQKQQAQNRNSRRPPNSPMQDSQVIWRILRYCAS